MPSKITVVREPVQDVNLITVSATEPTAPLDHGTTYIVSALGRWADLNVNVNDIVTWNALTNKFIRIGKLVSGQRFIVAAWNSTGTGPLAGKDNRIVTYNGGDVTVTGSWVVTDGNPPVDGTTVEVTNYQSIFNFCQFQYDATASKWFTESVASLAETFGYAPPSQGATDLSELSDVKLTDPVSVGEVLGYDGSEWTNQPADSGGGGNSEVTVTAGEDLAAGDMVYVSGSGEVSKAVATSEVGHVAIGAAKAAAMSGSDAVIVIQGVVEGYTGLTAGSLYYLSETAGEVTDTAPTDEGSYVLPVGVAITDTSLAINVLSAIQV